MLHKQGTARKYKCLWGSIRYSLAGISTSQDRSRWVVARRRRKCLASSSMLTQQVEWELVPWLIRACFIPPGSSAASAAFKFGTWLATCQAWKPVASAQPSQFKTLSSEGLSQALRRETWNCSPARVAGIILWVTSTRLISFSPSEISSLPLFAVFARARFSIFPQTPSQTFKLRAQNRPNSVQPWRAVCVRLVLAASYISGRRRAQLEIFSLLPFWRNLLQIIAKHAVTDRRRSIYFTSNLFKLLTGSLETAGTGRRQVCYGIDSEWQTQILGRSERHKIKNVQWRGAKCTFCSVWHRFVQ